MTIHNMTTCVDRDAVMNTHDFARIMAGRKADGFVGHVRARKTLEKTGLSYEDAVEKLDELEFKSDWIDGFLFKTYRA